MHFLPHCYFSFQVSHDTDYWINITIELRVSCWVHAFIIGHIV
jgi:hypothetical protein